MSMSPHGLELPNPFRPRIIPLRLGQGANQRNRKAEILAATRRRIAELGCRRVTNRMIADDCGLSAQTLYNLVGDRTRLISEAMTSHMTDIGQAVLPQLEWHHPVFIADAFWQATAAEQGFMRELAASYFDKNFEIGKRIEAFAVGLLAQALAKLRCGGKMGGGVDLWALAQCVTSANAAAYFGWVNDIFDIHELRIRIVRAHIFTLAGYIAAEETGHAHLWLEHVAAAGSVNAPVVAHGRHLGAQVAL